MVKPDYVIAAGSPSALLMSSIEGIRGIQVGSGQFIPSVDSWGSESPFPELESWLFLITRHTAPRLLTHPAIVFSNRAIDNLRDAPAFNVLDDVCTEKGISLNIDALALWDERHPLTDSIRQFCKATWGSRFVEMTTDDFRVKGYDKSSLDGARPLIIGNYDPLSVSMAISLDSPYIGSPLNKQQLALAKKSEGLRISYRLDDGLMMLRSFAEDPSVLRGHAQCRNDLTIKSSADIDSVLLLLTSSHS